MYTCNKERSDSKTHRGVFGPMETLTHPGQAFKNFVRGKLRGLHFVAVLPWRKGSCDLCRHYTGASNHRRVSQLPLKLRNHLVFALQLLNLGKKGTEI